MAVLLSHACILLPPISHPFPSPCSVCRACACAWLHHRPLCQHCHPPRGGNHCHLPPPPFHLNPTSRGLRSYKGLTHLPPGLALKLYLLFISPSPHKPHLFSPAARHWKKKGKEERKKPSMCSIFPSHSVIGVSSQAQAAAGGGGGFQSPESRASSMSSGGGGSLPSPSGGPACSRSWWAFYSETKTISHSNVFIFFPLLLVLPRYSLCFVLVVVG